MRRKLYRLGALLGAVALGGCVSTAVAVVKAPFQIVGQTADWLTVSQDEADRNRGREVRKGEERDRKAARKAAKREQERLEDGRERERR